MRKKQSREPGAAGAAGKSQGPGRGASQLARREFLTSAAALGAVFAGSSATQAGAAAREAARPVGINVPRVAGEYYRATVPDTLDLAERAHTGLAHFLNLISAENDSEMYWGVNHFYPSGMNALLGYDLPQPWGGNFAEYNPPAMTFNPTVLMACQGKAVEAMAMLRIMSGSRERLTRITNGSWYQSSTFNALGQRVQDVTPDGAYVNTLAYPLDIAGKWTGIFNYRPSQNWTGWNEFRAEVAGQRVSMGGSSSFLRHTDAVGSTTMATDQTGAVTWDVNFYPWGKSWRQTGSRYWNVFGDLGFENVNDVHPAPFRNYESFVGSWLTADPLGGDVTNPQSLNRYAYVTNNPASLNDPLGLDAEACSTFPDEPSGCLSRMFIGGGGGFLSGNPASPCSDPYTAIADAECGPFGGPGDMPILPPWGGIGGGGGGVIGIGGASYPGLPSAAGDLALGFTPTTVASDALKWWLVIRETVWAAAEAARAAGIWTGILWYVTHQYGDAPPSVHQSRKAGSNQAENAQVDRVAREFCVNRRVLGQAINDYKKRYGQFPLTQKEVEDLARSLPKLPGCTPTKE